jgi:tetratricopeptide (TPR) repeat protein
MKGYFKLLSATLVLMGGVLGGCGGPTVEVQYDRKAEYNIPRDVRRVAIAELGGQTFEDKRWGDIASDKLASALDTYNRKFNRYELVDRKRLRAILDERDLRMAISDTSSAAKAGELANVHAMIYGTVHVDTQDQHRTGRAFDPIGRSMKTVSYTQRYCLVTVNFTMDDIRTAKTLATHTSKQEYDSENDKKAGPAGIGMALGFGKDDAPPVHQIVNRLVDQAVYEFVSKISPYTERVRVSLEGGKSQQVQDGNQFAAAKEYSDALGCYRRAIEIHPDDHGALFNAGLMCEAMGELDQAYEYYGNAVAQKVHKKYIAARTRVDLARRSSE